MPDVLKLFVYNEVQNGADPEEIATALGVTEEWVREHVEAARLCFERQVVVVH
ncbi:MAG TPA: hypothetical protein VFA04_05065 [Bryobacteraceae bacterium]|nr:hypothetical protein [Bryobacteraceae bacterium]